MSVLHRNGTAEQREDVPRGHYFGEQGVPQTGVLCVADVRQIDDLGRSPPSCQQGRATGCTSLAARSIPGTPRRLSQVPLPLAFGREWHPSRRPLRVMCFPSDSVCMLIVTLLYPDPESRQAARP
ncbi:hypothetical protein IscW_ISCW014480 [Ixodes scapularis]|uniref:Uncharacterized protein n=1 Tax=Ixodes scapularis TaxID=6945 RepID=B7QL90_IXOSC|nr:hypothetical protein IscW_ISCW014480 [Ixodes scapularis]|eukprot:XP_002415945.1 hypothetical protein IscW_ISCW014480 [Ixodes scapularis]